MNRCHAALLDIVGIQRYVFSSNKLKENIGASYLIQQIYEEPLQGTIREIFPGIDTNVFAAWREKPEEITIRQSETLFEIGYIGGGNALLFFKEQSHAQEFVSKWTRRLLVETPGIITAAAIEEFDLDDFQKSKKNLFKKLSENKFKYIPQTIIPRHGITADCARTGYSQEVWYEGPDDEKKGYISSVANAKLISAKEANYKITGDFEKVLKNEYCFIDELDQLGQLPGEDSHIAVVHIDGNGMGNRFIGTATLEKTRDLSRTVATATQNTFKNLIAKITDQFELIEKSLGHTSHSYPRNKYSQKIIPLRPIIIGGDDITFVCNGKLGIYFAKLFLEFFANEKVSDEKEISACAGIAITKTKYPFYRGYALAEQLCANAKKARKEKKDAGSWLDFHIAYGGFSGEMVDIRKNHFQASNGNLCFRPYKIGSNCVYGGFDDLISHASKLKMSLPKNKISELREALTGNENDSKKFIFAMKARGLCLPNIGGKLADFQETLWHEGRTPYFDMIEILQFYPDFELAREVE